MSKILKIIPSEINSNEFVNIKPAKEFVPEWYRKSPPTVDGTFSELYPQNPKATNSTYKKCTPFFDAMTSGYIAFLTADLEIIKEPNGGQGIAYRTQRQIITNHSPEQWTGLPIPDGYTPFVFKWHNQFELSTPKGYSLLFTNPINRFDLPFYTITGLVDTDVFNLSVQYPFFIKKDFFGIIEKGTPITQIIPIKRDAWKRELEEFDQNKVDVKYEKYYSTIKRSYKNNFWFRKEYN